MLTEREKTDTNGLYPGYCSIITRPRLQPRAQTDTTEHSSFPHPAPARARAHISPQPPAAASPPPPTYRPPGDPLALTAARLRSLPGAAEIHPDKDLLRFLAGELAGLACVYSLAPMH
jgi:hypothetical protein